MNNSDYADIAGEINRYLDNEDSPRVWICKVNDSIHKIYSKETDFNFSNELIGLIEAEAKLGGDLKSMLI